MLLVNVLFELAAFNCRVPPFIRTQTFSGVLWTIAMAISVGFIKRERGDILAACDFEVSCAAIFLAPTAYDLS